MMVATQPISNSALIENSPWFLVQIDTAVGSRFATVRSERLFYCVGISLEMQREKTGIQ
jgi:hypothetical protein